MNTSRYTSAERGYLMIKDRFKKVKVAGKYTAWRQGFKSDFKFWKYKLKHSKLYENFEYGLPGCLKRWHVIDRNIWKIENLCIEEQITCKFLFKAINFTVVPRCWRLKFQSCIDGQLLAKAAFRGGSPFRIAKNTIKIKLTNTLVKLLSRVERLKKLAHPIY